MSNIFLLTYFDASIIMRTTATSYWKETENKDTLQRWPFPRIHASHLPSWWVPHNPPPDFLLSPFFSFLRLATPPQAASYPESTRPIQYTIENRKKHDFWGIRID